MNKTTIDLTASEEEMIVTVDGKYLIKYIFSTYATCNRTLLRPGTGYITHIILYII